MMPWSQSSKVGEPHVDLKRSATGRRVGGCCRRRSHDAAEAATTQHETSVIARDIISGHCDAGDVPANVIKII